MPGKKAPEAERREDILNAAYRVAARERLTGLTAQSVAVEAGVSKGLVFFHFGSRDALLLALLNWLLKSTVVGPEVAVAGACGSPTDRLLMAIRRDLEYLPRRRDRVELFFDYWVMGTRNGPIKRAIRSALDRYRDAYIPLSDAMVQAEPDRFAGIDAAALASNVAAFLEGCALRAVMDPAHFDVDLMMRTAEALVAHRQTAGR